MEPKQNKELEEENKTFCDRPFEEVEDGFYDDRGFYTSPNGSFWDDDHIYFNHFGFDRHGGTYDKYGIYQPGPNYDEKTGLYEDQKELIDTEEKKDVKQILDFAITKLREQEKNDERTIKKYEQPIEESEESDDEDKSNLTYDEEDFQEAYNNVMELEERKMASQKA